MSKNLFKPLIKKNIKYMQFNQFFLYCTHNNNEIKSSPKIRMKVEETSYETEIWKTISWQDIAIVALFWRRFPKQHADFQVSLSLCVQFTKPVAKIYSLSNLLWWWWIVLKNGWPTKGIYALFPTETIVTDSHHHKFPTRRK